MLKKNLFFWFCLLAISNAMIASDFLSLQKRVVDVFERNESAVVRVKAVYKRIIKDQKEPKVTLRVGTGFFIASDGHILTNASLVYQSERAWIEHNGTAYSAQVVGSDPLTNIALLKVDETPEGFTFLPLDNLTVLPSIGSMSVAVSCTLEFDPAPSLGLIQGYANSFGQRVFPTVLLRISNPAGPGEGGSPVLDLNGRLLGIMVASLPEIQSACVLPVKAVVRIRDDLLNLGKVSYSWFGLEVSKRSNLKDGGRVVIDNIVNGSPCSESLLRKGDSLISIGDYPITQIRDVHNATFFVRPEQYINIKALRGGQEIETIIQVRARNEIVEESVIELKPKVEAVSTPKKKVELNSSTDSKKLK